MKAVRLTVLRRALSDGGSSSDLPRIHRHRRQFRRSFTLACCIAA